jgi:hypothetical protein
MVEVYRAGAFYWREENLFEAGCGAFRIRNSNSPVAFCHISRTQVGIPSQANLYQRAKARVIRKDEAMKYAGLVVMPAGFFLSIAAILLFTGTGQRTAFVLCGLAVEAMGLVVSVRGHLQLRSENR